MPTIKCPQNHRSEATEKQLKEGHVCPECGNNMRMSNVVRDVVSSEAKEPQPKSAPAVKQSRSESETDA